MNREEFLAMIETPEWKNKTKKCHICKRDTPIRKLRKVCMQCRHEMLDTGVVGMRH